MKRLAIAALALSLAACSDLGGGASYGAAEAEMGAMFRSHAREVHGGLNIKCPFTADADLLAQYEPLAQRYAALKESVAGRSLAVDIAIIEADYNAYWEQNVVECGAMDQPGTQERVAQELARIDGNLQQLERMAGGI
ncbi:MAG: hypothetical protein H6918_03745 [Sphingomonadaceae bacterium]|nr:hypothetical protein [Sphingomonadaceae bacterium]